MRSSSHLGGLLQWLLIEQRADPTTATTARSLVRCHVGRVGSGGRVWVAPQTVRNYRCYGARPVRHQLGGVLGRIDGESRGEGSTIINPARVDGGFRVRLARVPSPRDVQVGSDGVSSRNETVRVVAAAPQLSGWYAVLYALLL